MTPEEQKAWKEFCSRNRKFVPADTPSLNDWHYFRPDDVESLFLSSLRNEKKVKELRNKLRQQTMSINSYSWHCGLCNLSGLIGNAESHADNCLNRIKNEDK